MGEEWRGGRRVCGTTRNVAEHVWWWRRELRRLAGQNKPVQLVEISRGEASSGFELRLPRGVIVRVPAGFDEMALRRLLGVLEC